MAKIQTCLKRIPTDPIHSSPLTLEKLRVLKAEQVIHAYQQICEQGDRTAALDYLKSYQQLFRGCPQFQAAYFHIARECLTQGLVADAIHIAGSDKEKQALLDDLLESVPETLVLIRNMAEVARSLQDEKGKGDYLLYCAHHLIKHGAFQEADVLLRESSKDFRDLFRLCPDWDRVQAFAGSMSDHALREERLQICQKYMVYEASDDAYEMAPATAKRSKNCGHSAVKRARNQ